jgi:hypothetical protein
MDKNQAEEFFRNVLSQVEIIRDDADFFRSHADSLEGVATHLEHLVQVDSEKLGIDPFEVKEF